MKRLAVISSFAALVVAPGCRSSAPAPTNHLGEKRDRAVIEARAALIFTNAVLIKPREDIPATNVAFKLTPLLIQQVTDSTRRTNGGPATIYYQINAVRIAGMNHLQMTYLWSCGKGKDAGLGIRLTLDSQGLPVIWEVLDDRSGPRVVFVSQSLEEKAMSAFGSPVPGRRFAVEQPLRVAPDVVVARVIEDGPMAMGPIIHLTANPCDISTLICRCMPTQARQLVGTAYYELKALPAAVKDALRTPEVAKPLDETLRLPSAF